MAAIALLGGAVPPAKADFGVRSFTATATNRDGSVDLEAGSHPYEYTLELAMNLDPEGLPEGTLAGVEVVLPPGLVGNLAESPRCSMADFEGIAPRCPGRTQIGVVKMDAVDLEDAALPIYNLNPPLGAAAAFGFVAAGTGATELSSLGEGGRLEVVASNLPDVKIRSMTETIWGVPADPGHDAERICIEPGGGSVEGCSTEGPGAPLLTLPTSCGGPLETTLRATSREAPGVSVAAAALSRDEGGSPRGLVGCGRLPFEPTIAVQPEDSRSDSPTALGIDLRLPRTEDAQLPQAHLKDLIVQLPTGLRINPSVGDGLLACSPEQIGLKTSAGAAPVEFTAVAARCPAGSKLGSANIETPALDRPLQGSVYLAEQGRNPFGSLLALYVAIDDPLRGIALKLAARVVPDPETGQLSAIFDDAPQLPLERLELDFFGGPRGLLSNPPGCGAYAATALLTPWSNPGRAQALRSDPFAIVAGPGGACVEGEARAPHGPGFEAGTRAAAAGASSPFVLRLSRENGSQRLRGLEVALPRGLTGRIAGLAECSAAQLATAAERGGPGGGALERARPSCPPGSEVGSVTVGAGTGTPLYLSGHAYLAGPYRGAPLSLALVLPALAGPFDLGTVAVRAALRVDRRTAAVDVVADPLPTILQGIPLDVRSLAIKLDRPSFALNPTNCAPMEIAARSTSAGGGTSDLAQRFQVGGCSDLGFEPRLSVRLLGPTRRGAHATFRTVLRARRDDAGLRRVAITLPGAELLDSRRIGIVCSGPQFAADRCPRGSVHGHAEVWSPLLDRPLEGPVYLRASHRRLPDLVAALDGQVRLDLVGRIDSVGGRIRSTFLALPDAPLSRVVLTLRGGKQGLLVNTGGVCARQHRAGADFGGQNGKKHAAHPLVKTDCGS